MRLKALERYEKPLCAKINMKKYYNPPSRGLNRFIRSRCSVISNSHSSRTILSCACALLDADFGPVEMSISAFISQWKHMANLPWQGPFIRGKVFREFVFMHLFFPKIWDHLLIT